MTQAFPLHWPAGWPRSKSRSRAKFQCSLEEARCGVTHQLDLMGAQYPVISTDLPLRCDGFPYASKAQPADTGVAVYFMYKGKQMVFACDQWDRIEHNIRAIEKTIEAIRGVERWGASDMMDRAYSAFEMLPPARNWKVELEFEPDAKPNIDAVEAKYRDLVKEHHPDRGGNREKFEAITKAREAARKELAA